jgi:hypothetical protein
MRAQITGTIARALGFCQGMTERQKVTTAKLLAIIESEFTQTIRPERQGVYAARSLACSGR